MTKDEEAQRLRAVRKRRMHVLSRRLDQWDPIGVYAYEDQPPPGEYDCLVGPTMRKLHDGAGAVEIADTLANELVDHFGLPPSPPPLALAAELRLWWDGEAATSGERGTP